MSKRSKKDAKQREARFYHKHQRKFQKEKNHKGKAEGEKLTQPKNENEPAGK